MTLRVFLQHALSLANYVSATSVIAANAAAARFSRLGFEPARKKTLAVSHHSLDVVLKAAKGFLKRKITSYLLEEIIGQISSDLRKPTAAFRKLAERSVSRLMARAERSETASRSDDPQAE